MIGGLAYSPQRELDVTDSSDPECSLEIASNARKLLLSASHRLESSEDLLLNPTPQHIQEAERLFELAAEDMQAFQAIFRDCPDKSVFRADALAFQATLRRVLALLNGALRVHWNRLRRMGSYHETYTASGAKRVCIPHLPSLDLKI